MAQSFIEGHVPRLTTSAAPSPQVAAAEHKHEEDQGHVHRCELTAGEVFRSLTFPKAVDAARAKAEYQNGILNITVPIAPATRLKPVDVKAA